MPPKNKPMKPIPKTRMGYAKNAWDDTMKPSKNISGSSPYSPVTWAVGASAAMNAAIMKKDPYAKPLPKPNKKGK